MGVEVRLLGHTSVRKPEEEGLRRKGKHPIILSECGGHANKKIFRPTTNFRSCLRHISQRQLRDIMVVAARPALHSS